MTLDIIIKQNTRILTPQTYRILRESLNPAYKSICDSLLNSAMRVEEFRWFASHPESYKALRRCISLPKVAIKKVKVVQPERDIMLSPYGCESIENFIRNKYSVPCGVSMWQALRRAAEKSDIGIEGITPKMFRKTFLSWLVVTHPEYYFIIAMSAGHTINVLQTHYAGIAFQKEDIQEMRAYVTGWGGE